MLTRFVLPCVPLVAIAAFAGEAVATQHLVRAGDDWSVLKDRVKPGDEIILMPGKHREVRFDGLKGEANRPITIRSASSDARNLATIAAVDVGIHLVDAEHVRIEHLLITGGRRAGVIVSGSDGGRSKHIALTSIYVAKTGDMAERSGLLIDRTDHMTVKDCRFEAWHKAGVHIRGASDIALVNAQFVGSPSTPDEFGVLIDGRTSSVILQRCRFAPGIATAIALGPADGSAAPAASADPANANAPTTESPVLVDGVTIERCLAKRPGTFITFGSVANALVRANTVVDAGVGYAFVEAQRGFAPVRGSTLLANLIVWTPGVMKSFAKAGGGSVPAGLSVENNLWYSAELPAALPLLGEFLGTVKSEQTLDIDPKLDGYDRPIEERAKLFGWTSA
jgi:hypothetical protein